MESGDQADQQKYWEELTAEEKTEELKRISQCTFETLLNMGAIVKILLKYGGRSAGQVLIPTHVLRTIEKFIRDNNEYDFDRYRKNPFNEKPKIEKEVRE